MDISRLNLWPTPKTIWIGGVPPEQLITDIEVMCKMNSDVEVVMRHQDFTILPEPRQIQVIATTPHSMGFMRNPSDEVLLQGARRLGLDFCSAEVGPHLRRQYCDQFHGELVWIAMKRIVCAGHPLLFQLTHITQGLYLVANYPFPGIGWPLDSILVFSIRQ